MSIAVLNDIKKKIFVDHIRAVTFCEACYAGSSLSLGLGLLYGLESLRTLLSIGRCH